MAKFKVGQRVRILPLNESWVRADCRYVAREGTIMALRPVRPYSRFPEQPRYVVLVDGLPSPHRSGGWNVPECQLRPLTPPAVDAGAAKWVAKWNRFAARKARVPA